MQAYAEGFELMHKSRVPDRRSTEVCRALEPRLGRPLLAARAGRAGVRAGGQRPRGARAATSSDSGEGRWTLADAIDHDVPTPVITRRAVRALLLARGGRLHAQGAGRAAQPVRRPRGRAAAGAGSDRAGLHPHRRPARAGRREPARRGARAAAGPADDAGHLRRHRRPRPAQAAARALQPRPRGRAARALQPDRRRAPRADRRRVPRRSRASRSASTRAASPTTQVLDGPARAHALRVGPVRRRRRPTASSARSSRSSTRRPASR